MPPVRDLTADVERHQGWLEKLDERVRKVEISQAKMLVTLGAITAIGTTIGSLVATVILKVVFKI